MKRCPYQGKRKYHSRLDAIMSQASGRWWNKMRPYLCEHCEMWHLTRRWKEL